MNRTAAAGPTAARASQHHGYVHSEDEYLRRPRRIEGQSRGLQPMVEDEEHYIDVLTQDQGGVRRDRTPREVMTTSPGDPP